MREGHERGCSMGKKRDLGAALLCKPVSLESLFNWPKQVPDDEWWRNIATRVRAFPEGKQVSWGIPFRLGKGKNKRVIMLGRDTQDVTVSLPADNGSSISYLCLLHAWFEKVPDDKTLPPQEGLPVAEYVITYDDESAHVQTVRARFEVPMASSPGPPWLAVQFDAWTAIDPTKPIADMGWGVAQFGFGEEHVRQQPAIVLYALPNPHPERKPASLTIRGLVDAPFVVAGLTAYFGEQHPLRYLPRRHYRVTFDDMPRNVTRAELDLGEITRIERTTGPRNEEWLGAPHAGVSGAREPDTGAEDLIEAAGAPDATMSLRLEGKKKAYSFRLGEVFEKGVSESGKAKLEVIGRQRQWLNVRIIDSSTGRPTPVRVHFSGPHGEYLPPYGHHSQVNTNWFEDYGADVRVRDMSYAYVPGEFRTELPVGDVFVEINKGFEYQPTRARVTVQPGQKELELRVDRWKDLRSAGWVTADTHVHFLSPHTAWLEAQAEGVNVVNLLASQWGRLFTNVGDYIGRVGVAENDTIVYVGTENRNHMLGHMSMLGTQGMPVVPMCAGGPTEAWIGDPDYRTLAEWAMENRQKGGVVIRPHFPYCGCTEDPVPIIAGLVDALETGSLQGGNFPLQEWYRYLNCGYRVAVAGGTDKMSASCPLGWIRTYARVDTNEPFTYDAWARAVRAGRTISTTGPLIDLSVDGHGVGDVINVRTRAGTYEVDAIAESAWSLGRIEVVCNGRVVASEESAAGAKTLRCKANVVLSGSGWIAARCVGHANQPGYLVAHTSPVYIAARGSVLFDGPAAEHMLQLVNGGIEYLRTLSTPYDDASLERMVRLYEDTKKTLTARIAAGK